MQLILLIGIPATGKSTFFRERYFQTHVRLSLDLLRTRHREEILFQACLEVLQPVVIDNTNVTRAERARYIPRAKAVGFQVSGFFLRSRVAEAAVRNAGRAEEQRVPDAAIHGMSGRLELPAYDEGFDHLHFVSQLTDRQFCVEDWAQ